MEPYLEPPGAIIGFLASLHTPEHTGFGVITEAWLGAMNHGAPAELKPLYARDYMRRVWEIFKEYPNVRFKDSYQKVLRIDQFGHKREVQV